MKNNEIEIGNSVQTRSELKGNKRKIVNERKIK